MSCYQITGGRRLEGRLTVQGAKNSVLPILAATLLAPGTSTIRNCPDLSDVTATLNSLRVLGCRVVQQDHVVTVDASGIDGCRIPDELMLELRSSVIFMGALLARLGRAELCCPGGCELGPRPIDLHVRAMRELGVRLTEENGTLSCAADHGLTGCELCLSIPSVGATENSILAACGASGVTTIIGAAREPEIVDLQNFLRAMGADVCGAGTSVIRVAGQKPLHPADYTVMGDRIAAATYLCAAGAAGGHIEVSGLNPDHLTAVLDCLEQAGCTVQKQRDRILLESGGDLHGISPVRTAPYPGFPTDCQAILMAALASGRGSTIVEENMFSSRYRHVDELRRMGADIETAGRVAVVRGTPLHGAGVTASDLRGGAALIVAGLSAEGTTRVRDPGHICRGYERLTENLTALGAEIRKISDG